MMLNKNYALSAYFLIGLFFLFSSIYNTFLPLHPDEAYYWEWSKDLSLSYYDHPPLVAVFIKAFSVFGDSIFSIRAVASFSTALSALFLFLLGREIYGEKVGLVATIIFLSLPIINAGATITTPDAPMSLFWTISLYLAYKAVSKNSTLYYVLAGVAIGLALLSKYTSLLILLSLFLYLVFTNYRALLTYKPWLAVITSIVVFLPVIIWNIQNQWISFTFQYKHSGTTENPIDLEYFGEYLGGLILLMTPVVIYVIIRYIFKKEYIFDGKESFIPHTFLFMTLFFMYKSLFAHMAANWYGPLTFGASIFAAYLFVKHGLKKLFIAGVAVALVLTSLIKFPETLHLPSSANFHNRLFGIDKGVEAFSKHALKRGDALICTDYLTRAAILNFYLDGHPDVYEPFTTRMSYYKFKYKDFNYNGKDCLVFLEEDKAGMLKKQCESFELLEKVSIAKEQYKTRDYYFYKCNNMQFGK